MSRFNRQLFLLLGALVLFVAAALVANAFLRARALADADRVLAARAQFLADTVDRTLRSRLVEVFTFAALPSFRGYVASSDLDRPTRAPVARAELAAILAADTSVRAVTIVDPTGKVILATDTTINTNIGARTYVRQAMAGQLYASPPGMDGGELSQYYSAPILDNGGNVSGALVLRVAVQELWDALGTEDTYTLVDENSVRLADHSAKPQLFTSLVPLAPNVAASLVAEQRYGAQTTQIGATQLTTLADAVKNQNPTTLTFQTPDGQTVRAAIRPLAINPWTIIVYEPEDSATAQARDALWVAIGMGLAGVVVAAGLASAVFMGNPN